MLTQSDIFERTRLGEADFRWVELPVGSRLVLRVMPDALQLDGVRVPVSAFNQQQIADLVGGLLPTPLIVDLIWRARVHTVTPHTISYDWWEHHMWEAVEQAHTAIEAQLPADRDPGEIVSTVGKSWCLSRLLDQHPGKAVNYGWPSTHAPYRAVSGSTPVWQPPSTKHCDHEWDYSQTCQLVSRDCLVDGSARDLRDVLRDPELAPLVSHEGPLRTLRQPDVPEITGAIVLPTQEIRA